MFYCWLKIFSATFHPIYACAKIWLFHFSTGNSPFVIFVPETKQSVRYSKMTLKLLCYEGCCYGNQNSFISAIQLKTAHIYYNGQGGTFKTWFSVLRMAKLSKVLLPTLVFICLRKTMCLLLWKPYSLVLKPIVPATLRWHHYHKTPPGQTDMFSW